MKALLISLLFLFPSTLFALEATALDVPQPKELRIIRITPEGEDVPIGRQIAIEFNRPVVAIGKMDRTQSEIPVVLSPKLDCQWRWLNTSALACNLNEKNAFTAATKYQLTVNLGIKARDGATIAQPYQHTFITQRPDVQGTWIDDWKQPNVPLIRLITNEPVEQASLTQSLVFKTDQKNYKAKVTPDLTQQNNNSDENDTDTITVPSKPNNDGRRWIIEPDEQLPLDASVTFQLKPGIVTTKGPEKSIAERDLISFKTFPAFQVLGLQCITNTGEQVLISQQMPQSLQKLCDPLAPIALVFNAPVARNEVKKNIQFNPALTGKDSGDVWGTTDDESHQTISGDRQDTYMVFLPWTKAAQQYTLHVKPRALGFWEKNWVKMESLLTPIPNTDLEDKFGRKLFSPITFTFTTDHRKPNYEMAYHDVVLEKNVDSNVPIYVNNLQSITLNYRSVTSNTNVTKQSTTQKVPQVNDVQFAIPLYIRGLLNNGSGALYGALKADPKVNKYPPEARLFAQVTPYQLQVKLGHFNTLVWVTDLATGKTVSDAKITIYKDTLVNLTLPQDILATAITSDEGIAILPGTSALDPSLSLLRAGQDTDARLFIRVDKDQDMAVMPVSYDYMIDTWRVSEGTVWESEQPRYGHLLAWGLTAQGIYRTGDTIQYKFYVRNQNNETLIPPPDAAFTLKIIDPTNKVVNEVKNITLSSFGSYSGEFALPKNAAVGWYQFQLITDFPQAGASSTHPDFITLNPMRVLVSDFTPAPFKVINDLNGDLFRANQAVTVNTQAKLHAGGPYTDAQARISATLNALPFTSDHPVAQKFSFDAYDPDNKDINHTSRQIYQTIAPLNDKGELETTFTLPKQNIVYGKLAIESAVQDERGKYIATQSQADYLGVDRFVGLLSPQWLYNAQKPATIQYIVVGENGYPVVGTAVDLVIERQITTAAKIKDAGNAYTTNYQTKWEIESRCQGISQEVPLKCTFTPQKAADYRIIATINDTKGNKEATQLPIWVIGKEYVLWNENSDNYLQINAEKKEYHIGDTARFIIKNPYPGAKALITVERYGILDYFVQTLDTSAPTVDIPIKADYMPGVYMSVTVFSPRVDKPLPNGQVDLGKPAFRMGYIKIPVKDAYKEIQVTAKTDQAVYRPRETVKVQLHAKPNMPLLQSEPMELAVAVVDESVFALLADGKDYYDPYKGFYHLDGLDLSNYSLLMRLAGRQKFEKKGANPGGDGGMDLGLRNFFKFVSYWNPNIQTDVEGNATVQFTAPDNLTGWRVLVLATTPGDRMGLGDANFKVNRPTELRPVMPNQVSEGDNFTAGFSVLNRTDKERTLQVSITAKGNVDPSKAPVVEKQTIKLGPYKRAIVSLPIYASAVSNMQDAKGEIQFIAEAGDADDRDLVEFILPVEKMRSLETAANYGVTTDPQVTEPLVFPDKIYTDIGKVAVIVSPSIIANVEGAFRYMKDYPYLCWEQILTKGVMAANYKKLKAYLPVSFSWTESNVLPQDTLQLASNFQAPNGGMSFFLPDDEHADPYLSAYTALTFNWLRQDGFAIPEQVEQKLHDFLLNYLRRDIAPDFYTAGMNATVRAVALNALAAQHKITLADLQRYQGHVSQMNLFGKANFVQAATQVPGGMSLALDVSKMILAQSDQSAGKIIFTETVDDGYVRILSSALRENCAILSAFTALAETSAGKELLSDVPSKLVRMITQTRKNRVHWENTQENMFCMNALVDYSRIYENVTPHMTVTASIDNQKLGETQFDALSHPSVEFNRAIEANDPGRQAEVTIQRSGAGRLYYTTQLSYAAQDAFDKATNAGMDIRREYSVQRNGQWILLHNPMQIKQGELIRIDLYLSIPAARNFVAVNDPIPGGLEPVNRDLATTSSIDAAQGRFKSAAGSIWFKFNDWIEYNVSFWSFYHQELRNNAAQFYADYLPAGNYHLSYTAQAIASGTFVVMPVHAEEMYSPDVFGRGIKEELVVK